MPPEVSERSVETEICSVRSLTGLRRLRPGGKKKQRRMSLLVPQQCSLSSHAVIPSFAKRLQDATSTYARLQPRYFSGRPFRSTHSRCRAWPKAPLAPRYLRHSTRVGSSSSPRSSLPFATPSSDVLLAPHYRRQAEFNKTDVKEQAGRRFRGLGSDSWYCLAI